MILENIVVSLRFCGPSNSGNGELRAVELHVTYQVLLPQVCFFSPPLETELRIETEDNIVNLFYESALIGEGHKDQLDLTQPLSSSISEAKEASTSYLGFTDHNFHRCFVCGQEISLQLAGQPGSKFLKVYSPQKKQDEPYFMIGTQEVDRKQLSCFAVFNFLPLYYLLALTA